MFCYDSLYYAVRDWQLWLIVEAIWEAGLIQKSSVISVVAQNLLTGHRGCVACRGILGICIGGGKKLLRSRKRRGEGNGERVFGYVIVIFAAAAWYVIMCARIIHNTGRKHCALIGWLWMIVSSAIDVRYQATLTAAATTALCTWMTLVSSAARGSHGWQCWCSVSTFSPHPSCSSTSSSPSLGCAFYTSYLLRLPDRCLV